MTIYSIYKATNIVNGKSYIGFTKDFDVRYQAHLRTSRKNPKTHFHHAIKKHGKENFQWEILCQSKDGQFLLEKMEPHFIHEYDTFNNGYNCDKGGRGILGFRHSDETKRIISIHSSKPKPKTFDNSGEKNPFFGKTHSEQTIKKMRYNKKEFYSSPEGISIKEQISKTLTGRKTGPRSEETKEKLRKANKGQIPYTKGKRYYHNSMIQKTISLSETDIIPEGYVLGRGKLAPYKSRS